MSENGKQILQRTFSVPMEARDGRIIEGCVVPYDQATKVRDTPDGPAYHEVFAAGAFHKQLQAADKVRLRFNHQAGLVDRIGRCQRLYDEASGLYGEFVVYPGTIGDQALVCVREGELTGFSIGFSDRYTHWERTTEGTVVRRNCHLHEVSLVEEPAYAGAVVTGMRSRVEMLGDLAPPEPDDEQLERLRAVGITF